ncbi:hypothetical protein B296_00026187 [Ensete ventricosum]|uniref:Uncharacterized protein n=1 Tax=Ensete ventricosum TaxID=4639 RepID=A0A427A1Y1_ENSVE|nr:hypothetical protein B296_00026187 [Ensete ventricosum]
MYTEIAEGRGGWGFGSGDAATSISPMGLATAVHRGKHCRDETSVEEGTAIASAVQRWPRFAEETPQSPLGKREPLLGLFPPRYPPKSTIARGNGRFRPSPAAIFWPRGRFLLPARGEEGGDVKNESTKQK